MNSSPRVDDEISPVVSPEQNPNFLPNQSGRLTASASLRRNARARRNSPHTPLPPRPRFWHFGEKIRRLSKLYQFSRKRNKFVSILNTQKFSWDFIKTQICSCKSPSKSGNAVGITTFCKLQLLLPRKFFESVFFLRRIVSLRISGRDNRSFKI